MNHSMRSPEVIKQKIQKEYAKLVENGAEGNTYKNLQVTKSTQLNIGHSRLEYIKPCVTDQWSISISETQKTYKEYLDLLIKNNQIKKFPPNGQVLRRCHISRYQPINIEPGRLFITQKEIQYDEYIKNNQDKQVIIEKCKKAIKKLKTKIKNNNEYQNFIKNKSSLRKETEMEAHKLVSLKKKSEYMRNKNSKLQRRKDKLHQDIKQIIQRKTQKLENKYENLKQAKDKFYEKVNKFRGNKNAFYDKKDQFFKKQKEVKQTIRERAIENARKHYDIELIKYKRNFNINEKPKKEEKQMFVGGMRITSENAKFYL